METFHGYLFAKLFRFKSKSEGPEYFLQQWDDHGKELPDTPIHKKGNLWDRDPALHKYLAQKVTISGALKEKTIVYENIESW